MVSRVSLPEPNEGILEWIHNKIKKRPASPQDEWQINYTDEQLQPDGLNSGKRQCLSASIRY